LKRVALITGGSRGIGFGIAQSLSKDGFDLAICGQRSENEVSNALEKLRKNDCDLLYVQADVSKSEDRKILIHKIQKNFGRLNVLINNAGVSPKERKDILEASEESFERLIRNNIQGPYFLTQQIAHWMIKQKESNNNYRACIITISSVSASFASTNRGDYCISKAGLSMATKLWAVRLAEFGIPVYEVRPGIIETDMTAHVLKKYKKKIDNGILLQPRIGLPEDVGNTVAILVKGDITYSTGQIINVDGGLTIQRL
jgi:NAD(P)-dependent dehydrogenase (short-subunit alcohol dehydrogenase family)